MEPIVKENTDRSSSMITAFPLEAREVNAILIAKIIVVGIRVETQVILVIIERTIIVVRAG